MHYAPIGVFDSGYGGLTILNGILKNMPQYDYIYIGDNARTPYGTRSFDTVYEYTLQAIKTFFEQGSELVVLACNTASAKALRTIQQNDLQHFGNQKRVLGVIRPSAEKVGEYSKTRHVGILGTSGTITSESYVLEINKTFPDITVVQEACPVWVPLVENNQFNNPGGDYFIKYHLDQLLAKDQEIDTIILGCTHYPLLMDQIKKYIGNKITLLSQDDIIAESLADYLVRHPEIDELCSKGATCNYFTTEQGEVFEKRASHFLGKTIQAEKIQLIQ